MQTLTYVTRDNQPLYGDLYAPPKEEPAPAVLCVHGGSWRGGTRGTYRHLGPFLASAGYAVFAIDYRLVENGRHRHPAAAEDVRAAAQFLKTHAAELKIDPNRIALMGDSAGAHLAALIALTEPGLARVLVGVYGIYDLAAHYTYECSTRPHENAAEALLGVSLCDDRRAYFDASPLSYVTRRPNAPAVLLAWGTVDDIVDPRQSEAFRDALKAAGFYVRTVVLMAPHYWMSEPLEERGSLAGFFASRLLRFLDERLL
jgi:acetyl esterase/lipase